MLLLDWFLIPGPTRDWPTILSDHNLQWSIGDLGQVNKTRDQVVDGVHTLKQSTATHDHNIITNIHINAQIVAGKNLYVVSIWQIVAYN